MEEYDSELKLPKIFSQWGHTFWDNCILKMWKYGSITCPICKSDNEVTGMKDLPQTNYSLLKLLQIIKSNSEKMSKVEKYQSLNIDNMLLKIEEHINREHPPKTLILHGVYGNELIYKEEQDILMSNKVGAKLYSFNKNSFLRNYFGISEDSKNIGILRKTENCKHQYPWSENYLRLLVNTCLAYGFFRPLLKITAKYLTRKFGGEYEDNEKIKTLFDLKYFFLAEVGFVLVMSVYRTIDCWMNPNNAKSQDK